MLVETDWNSCSGARASISTLKMKPAAAAPWRPRVISGPALRNACSLNMITSTAGSEPAALGEREVLLRPRLRSERWRRLPRPAVFARRAKANGTTSRLSAGAAVMPIATADWPLRTLTATKTAKIVRKQDSERISATKRPKRCWPARKPRAK